MAFCLLTAGVVCFLLFGTPSEELPAIPTGMPTLTLETPPKLNLQTTQEFSLDVEVSALGDAQYPAASMSILFDPSRMEFLGIGEGNVFVADSQNTAGRKLPIWSCNVESSNALGKINILYLDMTGGENAFCRDLLAEEDNVVLRLKFRLRGSVRAGDVLEVAFEDAIFAASNETQSLAMTAGTLKTKNSKIVVGDGS